MRARRQRLGLGAGVLVLAWAARVGAQDRDVPVLGGEAAISAGAVAASGRSAAMAWYNPAALGANQRTRLEASGQAFVVRLRRIPGGLTTQLPDASRSTAIRSRELMVVPSATVFARGITKSATGALALFVTSFDDLAIDVRSGGRTDASEYAQQIKVTQQRRRYNFGPSFGFAITSRLRLGLGGFVVYDRSVLSSRAWARANTLGDGPRSEQFIQADVQEAVRSWGAQFVIGVQWDPLDFLHLALVVRSPRVWFFQRTDRSAVSTIGGTNPQSGVFAQTRFLPELDTGVSRPNDPFQVTAAMAWSWGRSWVAIEGDLAPPRGGGNDEGRRMVLNARLGVRGRITRHVLLGGGVYTDRSPLVVADDFLDFDVDTYGVTFGGELRRPVRLGANERARRLVFRTAVALRYALSVGRAGRMQIDLSELGTLDREVLVTAGDPVAVTLHDLGLHIGSGLEF